MKDGAQKAEPVVLPLLVRALGMDEVAQVSEVDPNDLGLLRFSVFCAHGHDSAMLVFLRDY